MARYGSNNADYDREPGNSSDTKAYAQRYDPFSGNEFSNQPELSDRLIIQSSEQNEQQRLAQNAERARKSTQFFPSVGKFIVPKENTWAAHEALVLDETRGLEFNPGRYVYFDKIIADKLNLPTLCDPNDEKCTALRTNLAVLRNDIIGMYMKDGSFDPGDERYLPKIVSIANAIGDGFANDKWYRRLFFKPLSVDVASAKGTGARAIYNYLLELQTEPSVLGGVAIALGKPDCNWGLPPLADTPFDEYHLQAPLPPASFDNAAPERSFREREIARGLSGPALRTV